MKIKYQVLIILTLFVLTVACENSKKNSQESITKTESKEATNKSENKVNLDNGKRWIANQETTEGINSMIQLMDSLTDQENASSYKTLADSLNSEFKIILKKCTMKGEAHNQLHNYLFPMKETFRKLSSSDLNECRSAFDDLNAHLSVYKEYFE